MKHFMQPRSGILRENHLESPNSSNKQKSSTSSRKQRCKENAPPSDPNIAWDASPSPAAKSLPPSAGKLKSPLPPRPPSSNPLKRKLIMDPLADSSNPGASDSGVKVIVRVRPPNKDEEDGETIVEKASIDSLSILGQTFTFDSVADREATQVDIFQLVGAPLVENCLAGFNSSVFAYGQTGSGKTYTMWGPANALLEENALSDQQGLTPRVLERLFARMNEEKIKHADNQLKYQCRCSFLEIYNEQITDLLDPSQRNLQIREDTNSGVYVENLTEEFVSTMKDVSRLLTKGLANRRTGATSINAESSRSHSVFTCVVESRSESTEGNISFKTSRINLVDLAGSERQKLTGAAGERLKEAGNINRSLSQLGNLINILAEVSQTGKHRHIPYRDSRLTFLLQESLGGNAKLAMVCAISPAQSCKSETFSTLRFAKRAKAIKNKAVVNEEMQGDVKVLREVIRQLKDELLRMRADSNPLGANNGYSTSWNARKSLHLLKFSLSRPTTLPHIENDSDEEMEIDEEAVERLCNQVGLPSSRCEETNRSEAGEGETSAKEAEHRAYDKSSQDPPQQEVFRCTAFEDDFKDTVVNMEVGTPEGAESMNVDCAEYRSNLDNPIDASLSFCKQEQSKDYKVITSANANALGTDCEKQAVEVKEAMIIYNLKSVGNSLPSSLPAPDVGASAGLLVVDERQTGTTDCADSSLSIVPSDVSPVLKSPTPTVSPRVNDSSRNSLRTSTMVNASQKDLKDMTETLRLSFAKSVKKSASKVQAAQRSKSNYVPTDLLAASLHRGLEVFENHRQSLALRQSFFRFPLKSADSKLALPIGKAEVGVQTLPQDETPSEDRLEFFCMKCRNPESQPEESNDSSNMQLVPIDGSYSDGKLKKQVPKAVEKVLAGAIRREMALEEVCSKQTSEIMHLNRLVQQYKHERECNAIIGQTREDKILRLESLMDGVLPTEDFMEEELASLTNEHKLLKEKYENHSEVLRTKIELKRVQDELEQYRNFFELGEREVLLEEVQDLRSHLQSYVDSSSVSGKQRTSSLRLTSPHEATSVVPLSSIPEIAEESVSRKLEQERLYWTEAESKWISLAEELRIDLEASRSSAEKLKHDLDSEKKCSEELKEAMQMAMVGHARMLEQYADLEEKHMMLLARHRNIQDGINDVKKAAAKAGVRGAESKFINALAAEISALKVEREKERRYFRDEIKGLQAQLRDTAEAVQAAGELLVRLKEADELIADAEKRALKAEQETEKACEEISNLKKKHEKEISTLNQFLAESQLPKEALRPASHESPIYDAGEPCSTGDHQWKEEFEPFFKGEDSELSKLAEPSSWFSGYDRCNI